MLYTHIDWQAFMARHDLIWTCTPKNEFEGAWLGNGMVGCMLWLEDSKLRLQVFRGDVEDHRDFEYGYVGYTRSRLQIGSFYLPLSGDVESCDLRLDLYRATLVGQIADVSIRVFVHAHDPVICCDVEGADSKSWRWDPAKAISTRFDVPETEELVSRYVKDMQVSQRIKTWEPNPPARIEQEDSLSCSVQDLKGGGQHAVAWQTSENQLLASVCKSFPAGHVWHQPVAGAAAAQAKDWIRRERSDEWEQSHIDWWAEYYPKSFVSLPSEQVETLYWTQIYKMGSITRAHYPMTDTAGIWQTPSAWPYITWNLNVQLIYYPYYVSNRFELAESLINSLWNCRENLRKNIRPVEWQRDAYWVGLATGSDLDNPRHMDQRSFHKNAGGNLVWALHCVWLHWRHSMDAGLRDKFHELLRGAVTYMLYLTEKRDDGLFHLAETMSPEFGDTKDATYDVALLRWGLKTLIGLTDEAGAELDRWKDVLENLVPYHQDELGFMIGEGVSFDRSHRHFSHLMQIWPLYEVTVAQPENRELIEKSIDHFYKINQAEYDRTGHWDGFAAYTWTALSLLSAATGKGKDALRYLKGFMDYDLVRPNSLYGEMGPCQESPLSAVSCVHEMLLQSWGGIIRPFPAMPPEWKEAVFHQFSAEGGFEVSAEWKDSRLQWVLVHSRAGEPCRVAAENLSDMELKIDGQIQEFSIRSDESVHLALDSGASALFCRPGVCMAVRMLESDPVKQHCYGLNENRDQMKDSNEVKVYENAV